MTLADVKLKPSQHPQTILSYLVKFYDLKRPPQTETRMQAMNYDRLRQAWGAQGPNDLKWNRSVLFANNVFAVAATKHSLETEARPDEPEDQQ